MWMLTLFDLPTDTPMQRRVAQKFRKRLVQDGFLMLQYSVYGRPCPTPENAAVHEARVTGWRPDEGHGRILMVTDQQFGRRKVCHGKTRTQGERAPAQITCF